MNRDITGIIALKLCVNLRQFTVGPLAYGEVDHQQKGREDTLQETNGLEFYLVLTFIHRDLTKVPVTQPVQKATRIFSQDISGTGKRQAQQTESLLLDRTKTRFSRKQFISQNPAKRDWTLKQSALLIGLCTH